MTETQRRRSRTMAASLGFTLVACASLMTTQAFVPMPPQRYAQQRQHTLAPSYKTTDSALNVWWFGGDETTESTLVGSDDSCELVAVRIERTSPNSRRIAGETTVKAPLMDVWAILTDYDQLSVHVPNLVESKRVPPYSRNGNAGDGQYKCRLYQKGAQKIIGFEFGASVTMDMAERILSEQGSVPQSRSIDFKCVDSPFFSEFDGSWELNERMNEEDGKPETVVSYVVDVRPRGPVPVAALEWRIREDVPTNLRAVKQAALKVGYKGVMAEHRLERPRVMNGSTSQEPRRRRRPVVAAVPSVAATATATAVRQPMVTAKLATVPALDWGEDETMAAYLKKEP